MCFGDHEEKKVQNTPNPAVSGAANDNLSFVKNLQSQGFKPYGGQMVANFSPLQSKSFNMGDALGTAGVPYTGTAENLIHKYAGGPASSVNPNTISSMMGPYMNQYVSMALAPQIEAQNQQFAGQNKGLNAAATSSGAFGDARTGIEAANLTTQQNLARQGLIGNAYNAAFNTAIGAGAQDASRDLQGQTTNAQLNEAMLARALGGAGALQNLGGYSIGQGTNLTNLTNTLGQQQTANEQAKLGADYNQYLMGMQYPFQTAQLYNQTIGAANPAMPSTQTTTTPDNSGWALGGALLPSLFNGGSAGFGGSALGMGLMALSDKREKKDIKKVGTLKDGTPIKTFAYKDDPSGKKHMGFIAQDLEKTHPEAVADHMGRKYVDYAKVANDDNLAAAIGA